MLTVIPLGETYVHTKTVSRNQAAIWSENSWQFTRYVHTFVLMCMLKLIISTNIISMSVYNSILTFDNDGNIRINGVNTVWDQF